MKWIDYFDEIYVLNLLKRTDRLLQITQDFEKYEIPFTRINAIEMPNGAEGLRDTMVLVFNDAIEKNYRNILIFEDDCKIVIDPFWFHETMNDVVDELPISYHLCFLGGQASNRFSHFHSKHLLPVQKYFSTHSVAYSIQGIKEILARPFGFPIDNWMVEHIQPMGHCYTIHPLLCSQYAGFSDIGKNVMDWNPFIVPRHQQKINEMGRRW